MTVKTAKTKKHYVNNKTMYEEMVKYKDACKLAEQEGKKRPQIPRYIGDCLMLICKKLSTKPNFMNYTYRDEMISDGIENCVASVHNFDPSKSLNPFAYFTQIAWNAFIRRITMEKKQSYIKHKNYQNTFLMEDHMDGAVMNTNEHTDNVIRAFEEKIENAKLEKKRKAGLINEDSIDNGHSLGDSK